MIETHTETSGHNHVVTHQRCQVIKNYFDRNNYVAYRYHNTVAYQEYIPATAAEKVLSGSS